MPSFITRSSTSSRKPKRTITQTEIIKKPNKLKSSARKVFGTYVKPVG